MNLPRFLIAAPSALGERIELPRNEAAHVRVRRLRRGEAVALFDGAGHSYVGRIDGLTRATVTVEITQVRPAHEHESPLAVTVAFGLLKSDRVEWLIEKATELGVACLQPFASTHTLGRPSPNRQARWRQIAAAAAKQCGRSAIPTIAGPVDFTAVLTQPSARRLLLAEQGGGEDLLQVDAGAPGSVQLIVGAEGGLTDDERAAASAAGCTPIDLGPRILRAETAAIAAIALVQARWGDLNRQAEGGRRKAESWRKDKGGKSE